MPGEAAQQGLGWGARGLTLPGLCRRRCPDVPGLARGVQRGMAGAAAGEGPPAPGQGRLPRHRGHQRQGHEVRQLVPGNPTARAGVLRETSDWDHQGSVTGSGSVTPDPITGLPQLSTGDTEYCCAPEINSSCGCGLCLSHTFSLFHNF